MQRIIREPLFQFFLIGASLFLAYNLFHTRQDKQDITIDNNLINELTAKWKMQWNKEPLPNELKDLVHSYIGQEVLYREALDMNLDHNDEIIKRRLVQKMEFLSDEMSDVQQPTESMLKDYYEKNKKNYTKPAVFTLRQVYFSRDTRKSPWEDAQLALESGDPANGGDRLSLPSSYTNTASTKLDVDFGRVFAAALDSLPTGKWTGPINSGYGVHLVFIEERKSSGFYDFEEVVDKVTVDYNFEAGNEFKKKLILSLLEKYTISIDVTDGELKKMLGESY